jgi:hypothetical protein
MEAAELRLGNLVKPLTENVEIGVVTMLKSQKVKDKVLYLIGINESFSYLAEHLSPIFLTEEWLLKMGFEQKYKSPIHSVYAIQNGKFSYYFWHNDKRQYLSICGSNFVCNYVHTLQNIIHSLTGEELTVEQRVEDMKTHAMQLAEAWEQGRKSCSIVVENEVIVPKNPYSHE